MFTSSGQIIFLAASLLRNYSRDYTPSPLHRMMLSFSLSFFVLLCGLLQNLLTNPIMRNPEKAFIYIHNVCLRWNSCSCTTPVVSKGGHSAGAGGLKTAEIRGERDFTEALL